MGIIRYLMKEADNQGIYPYLPMGFIDELTNRIYETIKSIISKIGNFNEYDCMYFFDVNVPNEEEDNDRIEIQLIKGGLNRSERGSFNIYREKPIIKIYINQIWTENYMSIKGDIIKREIKDIITHEITHYKQWLYAIETNPRYKFKGNRNKIRGKRRSVYNNYEKWRRYVNEQREVEARCTEIISNITDVLNSYFEFNGKKMNRDWKENNIGINERIEYIYKLCKGIINKKLEGLNERNIKYIQKKIIYTIRGFIDGLM